MGSVVTQPRTPDADIEETISADWAVLERDRESSIGRDGRRCSDPSAVCKLVGTWFGFCD